MAEGIGRSDSMERWGEFHPDIESRGSPPGRLSSMSERLILLTNDDGLWAPGLAILARAASAFGRVITVAPDRNRSAISSALSLHNILRLNEIGPDRFACDGTPVDCVLLGVCEILGRKPDWVLSGVNHGFNLGEDVFYSGTVGAAFEGRMQGARAAAFSIHPYFWIGGDAGPTYAKAPGSDAEAVFHGFASVTPLRLDMGCPETLARRSDFDSTFNG